MSINRRRIFRSALPLLALATAPSIAARTTSRRALNVGRAQKALKLRVELATEQLDRAFARHTSNGDESRHDPAWVCFSKGLPHAMSGEADSSATEKLWRAVRNGGSAEFEDVPLGGYMKLANPQAAYSYDLVGPDPQQLPCPAPPAFSSAEGAAEMVELYWHALLRDIPFSAYDSEPLARRAAADLSRLVGFSGPRESGGVSPPVLFRGGTPGGLIGPYVSQFLWRDLPWTPIRVPQKIRVAVPGKDYLTQWPEWLRVQNGDVYPVNDYEDVPRYIRTARDLGEYVHRDFTYQAFLGACLILFRMNAPLDGAMRYQYSVSQTGFVTLGPSDILHLVASVANVALKAAWFQKWVVHRRLRPEEFAARVERYRRGEASYPLHMNVLESAAPSLIHARFGSALLPQAYPEGTPLHPAYPSGHAVIAGACTTVLKACFAETFVIPHPQVPSDDGLALRPYSGPLTVGGELDKLAENISLGRNLAGIHWRSDAIEGMRLGERVAIDFLRQARRTSDDIFSGFTLKTFDGTTIEIN